jgi:hypothetical protein
MKITEIILEDQETDEGVLGNVAAGAGKALGAVGKGLGAVSGAWQGAKDQFQKGQALGQATVGGHIPKAPRDTSVRDQEFARLTGQQPRIEPTLGAPAAAASPAVGQITAAIKNLRTRDLESLKKTIDKALAAKVKAAPAPTGTPTLTQVQGGGGKRKKPAAAPATAAPAASSV